MEHRNSKPVLIQTDGLLPMVNKYLEQLSPAQWIMLAEGNLDSSLLKTITDMCCDIVQKLTTDVVNIVKPRFEEFFQDSSQDEMDKPGSGFTVTEDPIDEIISSAVKIPKNTREMEQMLAQKMSDSVTTALSVTPKNTAVTSKPCLDISSISALCSVVLNITELFKTYLGQIDLKQLFGELRSRTSPAFPESDACTVEDEKRESSKDIKPPVSVQETTKAVEEILLRRFSEKVTESADVASSISQDAQAAVLHIVEMITEEERSSVNFNNNEGENSFALSAKKRYDSERNVPKCNFLEFARKKFTEMGEKLKCACACCRIQQASGSPDENIVQETEFSKSQSKSSLIEFDNIQKDLERWYDKLEEANETLELNSEEICKFSRQLTDEMHQQMLDFIYKSSMIPLESPAIQLVYKVTQDIVGRFVQQALLWLHMEALNHSRIDKAVSDALNDIVRHLTPKHPTQEEMESQMPESPEPSTSPEESDTTSEESSQSPTHFQSYETPNLKPGCFAEEMSNTDGKLSSGSSESTDSSLRNSEEKLTNNFMHNLVMQLVSRLPEKEKATLEMKDVQYVVKRLSIKASMEVIGTLLNSVKNIYQLEKITNTVIKGLFLEFDSPEKLIQAALLPDDPSFVDGVFAHLRSHLGELVDSSSKKSKFCRFFFPWV